MSADIKLNDWELQLMINDLGDLPPKKSISIILKIRQYIAAKTAAAEGDKNE